MTSVPMLRYAASRVYVSAKSPTATLADCSTRAIARALKQPGTVLFRCALARAVAELAPLIPACAQLVPMPRANGCSGGTVYLAAALAAAVPHATVVLAVQRRQAVESSQLRRRKGLVGVSAHAHAASFARAASLDAARPVVLVDNVLMTGATAQGAAWVLRRPDALAIAFAAGMELANAGAVASLRAA